ncbi:MAG: aminodeoxychorismate/anthranilate synthase component II [Gammaproteobacteria bacterium]
MILLIDNYDSFVYNLARYINELGFTTQVVRNDAITLSAIQELPRTHIVLSPGPGTPQQAGISLAVVEHFAGKIPLLGVCLGHQAIGQAYGGNIVRAKKLVHGRCSQIWHDGQALFRNLPNPFAAGRYHSLIVSDTNLPQELVVAAYNEDQEIMALRHRELPIFGVQFHPESILTENGYEILRRFLLWNSDAYSYPN